MKHFVLTANSPGEVATWLTPTVRALRRHQPDARITVFIVPCAFAAGTETDVVARLTEVDDVYGPKDYWRIALGGAFPQSWPRNDRSEDNVPSDPGGAVLYLGGDLVHALRLARRLRYPALAYIERGSRWTKSFHELLVADTEARDRVIRQGENGERISVVGNLMVDAVAPALSRRDALARFALQEDAPIVAVFPGSRPYEIRLALPFLLRGLEEAMPVIGDMQVVVSLSSFVDTSVLEGRPVVGLEGARLDVRPASDGEGWTVRTDGGITARVVQGMPYDVMQVADVALTLPGSNTAEMAGAGLPMIVVLPLNLAERIPLPGAAQYVEKLPFFGRRLKSHLVRQRAAQMPFVAWPNRKAQKPVVPEVRGDLVPADVAQAVAELLQDEGKRHWMGGAVRDILGPGGAADRIVQRTVLAATRGSPAGAEVERVP